MCWTHCVPVALPSRVNQDEKSTVLALKEVRVYSNEHRLTRCFQNTFPFASVVTLEVGALHRFHEQTRKVSGRALK